MREAEEEALSSQSILLFSVELQNLFRMTSVVRYGKTEPVNFTVYLFCLPVSTLANKTGLAFSWTPGEGLGLHA